MFKKKECIAMLLAGGQGRRLSELTRHTAKPAVSFGGKYRIIDFALSNCANSGIDTVGVLTQYQPLTLNEYVGNGSPWELDRASGGLFVLPPYQGSGADWYRGTANAVYQNLAFIRRYAPEYVLILSADHVYRMDYSDLLAYHKRTRAVCTVATVTVPKEEASRFGICLLDEEERICGFEEKPAHPKGTQASMGIYAFNTEALIEYLERDASSPNSSGDFGKDVIPAMLARGERLCGYRYAGYWRDVGTVKSLWEANMDLLRDDSILRHADPAFDIRSRAADRPPQFIGESATVSHSMIAEGAEVYGTVKDSVIGCGVRVAEGAEVHHSVIMADVTVERGARVHYAIVDSDSVIEEGAEVGEEDGDSDHITVVGQGRRIRCKKERALV